MIDPDVLATLPRREFHRAPLQVNQEAAFHHIEELVLVVVLVPVVLTLHDPEPDNGIVDLAERLIEPLIGDTRRERSRVVAEANNLPFEYAEGYKYLRLNV